MRKLLLSFVFAVFGMTAFAQNYVSISDINYVSPTDLAACEDTSAYLGQTIITRGVVVTPGNVSEVASGSVTGGARPFIFIQDTAVGGQSTPFAGIEVMGVYTSSTGSLQVPATFTQALPGDIVEVKGVVGEYNGSNQLSLADANSFSIVSLTSDPIVSDTITVGDLNDAQFVNNLTTGEQYEGSFVTVTDVTVTSVVFFSGNRVSVNVADANGNSINLSDRFLAQKMSSWSTVNTNSPQSQGSFVPPVPGTFYNSISGVVRHDANGCTGDNGRGYEINAFDASHFDIGYAPPYIANFERDPAVPTSNQDAELTCSITDFDGSVDSVAIVWSAIDTQSVANFTVAPMNLVAGTTDEYLFEIPKQADGTLVRYYVYASDNDGNVSYYPSTPITQAVPNVDFYTVRDNGLNIADIQFTFNANGASTLAGQEVTVTGIVTASTKIGDLGYLYLQDENASAWGGIWCVGLGLNSYYRDEEVTVTGTVEEYFGMTRLNVSASSKTGNKASITPIIIDPSDSASYANFGWEPYESMLVRYEDPQGGTLAISQTNLGFGDYAVSTSATAPISKSARILAGRQASTAYSSLNVQLVTDTAYANLDGEMNVTPIVVDNSMTFDAVEGILFYGFSNFRLLPRNNNDFIGASVTLDSISVATSPIGVDEWAAGNVKVYPNPATDLIVLESTSAGTWSISTILGQELAKLTTTGTARVDVSNWQKGTYVARFSGSEGAGTVVLVIQ
jgi:DNA/RNA endonuclease YhcR with UshA esterase domain